MISTLATGECTTGMSSTLATEELARVEDIVHSPVIRVEDIVHSSVARVENTVHSSVARVEDIPVVHSPVALCLPP
jgi:hypothetical protein